MTYKIFNALILIAVLFHQPANSQTLIEKSILNIINGREISTASVGISAIDLETNKYITNINADKSLCPASVLKISTTIVALETLGENFTFKTTIGYTGKIVNNELLGDIIISGTGDPTLGSEGFDKSPDKILMEIVTAVKQKGINKIKGNIITDDSFFDYNPTSPKWIYEDFGNYFGAGAFGLNWRDNSYSLFLKSTQESVTIDKCNPYIEGLTFDNQLKTAENNKDDAFIFGEPYEYNKKINGTIPENKNNFEIKGALPDPPLQLAKELQNFLDKSSIKITGKSITTRLIKVNTPNYTVPETIKIYEIVSPPLKEIIVHTNINSDNTYAECLLKYLGKKTNNVGSIKSGIESIKKFWTETKINVNGLFFEDGSGLSRFNTVSTNQIVAMLQFEYKSKNKAIFMNSLPIAGVSGGMKNIGKNTQAQNNIFAKTGYMTRVRSYAGYMKTKNNNNIVFSIMINNYSCSASEAKKKLEEIMLALMEY
jgi:serine-type D-Ala-D-Ala carboxypeptidase/endopeptidase (penicillin-binding protein 4)